jgi:(1->4)-alpha-D-glucan 1-alpha-D-glucosylmutase
MRIPIATYRIQFTPEFGFAAARAIVPYLHELGITDIYASPISQARTGSLHGYDVVDPNNINPELGSAEEFEALIAEVRRHGMGWVQDIVPNHMAYDGENKMLMDVLENGQGSRYTDYFDIDWNYPFETMRDKLLAPFLGGFYGECLENGDIKLGYDESGLHIHYHSLALPAHIESYSTVFAEGVGALRRRLGARHPDFIKLLGVLYTLKNLPPKEEVRERADQIAFVKSMLWELYSTSAEIKEFIDSNIARFNGTEGEPASFDPLDRFLAEQLYRLSFWKVAAEELNYRRFFNINELISMRVEEEKVFRHIHELVFKLVREGKVTGLRIDHIDGLYDPLGYLRRIKQEQPNVYLVVEKILALDEELPPDWPLDGTTGYDFLNYAGGIFCARKNKSKLTDIYGRFSGVHVSCHQMGYEKKRLIIGKYMAGDIDGLARLLRRISGRDRHAADFTLYGLRRALVEVLTFFPVYRSYVTQENFSDADRAYLSEAIRKAKASNPGLILELKFIERFLLLQFVAQGDEEKRDWIHFVMRFQQLTGPLMAKGFEDTTLYVYNRLLSLNEVGGDPDRFGVSLQEFHRFNSRRRERWPRALNATATHDTKRGEDARTRISVLSEIPEQWEQRLKDWSRINRGKKSIVRGEEMPDRNDEYFLYQTLIGAFPVNGREDPTFMDRLKAYIIKSVREAKVYTEWLKPDLAYEEAFLRFVEQILDPAEGNRFPGELAACAEKIAFYGMINSLSQTLLKIVVPGVPDFYQGTELWDLSFVDPDNRRAVDYERRRRILGELSSCAPEHRLTLAEELLSNWQDGRIKLFLTHEALNFRRHYQDVFLGGEYIPLRVCGDLEECVCAFARRQGSEWVVTAVPRLVAEIAPSANAGSFAQVWGSSAIALPDAAPRLWRNVLTGESLTASDFGDEPKTLRLNDLFAHFPVGLVYSGGATAATQRAAPSPRQEDQRDRV